VTPKIGGPSIWLRIVAFYFLAGGVLFFIIAMVGVLGGLALNWVPTTTPGLSYAASIGLLSAMAVALFVTGILLRRRLKSGAVLGLVLTLYPLALALVQHQSVDWRDLFVMALTTLVLLSVWRELERRPAPPL
jgi:hypothetical protein